MTTASKCANCDDPATYGQTFCSTLCEIEFQMRRPGGALGGTACPHDTPAPPDPRASTPTPPSSGDIVISDPPYTSVTADAVLPTDSDSRKDLPIFSGVLNYFPLAVAAVARVSKRGNDKHNPGQPLHWARGKSMDHCDCIARHLIDVETVDPKTGEYEDAMALAWRALAKLQELEEKRLGKGMSRGSKESK